MAKRKERKKHYPLPKRFGAALSERAYANLRRLNGKYGLGNNFLLTVLLENLEEISDGPKLERAYARFIEEYGAPKPVGSEAGKE